MFMQTAEAWKREREGGVDGVCVCVCMCIAISAERSRKKVNTHIYIYTNMRVLRILHVDIYLDCFRWLSLFRKS